MTSVTSVKCPSVCLIPIILVTVIAVVPTFAAPVSQSNSQMQTAGSAVLEDGTPLKLRISRTVSSTDAHVGDTVDFEVLEEVRVGSLLLIPKGGVAWATVTEAESKRRMARGGKLNMNIDSVRLVDGEKVALRAVKEVKGGGHTGAMTGGIVATAIVFWPAAPFFLFMHGKDITVPKGTEITAYINGNFPFDSAKFQSVGQSHQAAMPVASPTNSNSSSAPTMLEILSSPGSADIELDGSFAGDTPSSIGVASGQHTIRIIKNGYKSWERKVYTSTGTVKITAELEAIPAVTPAVLAAPAISTKVAQEPRTASDAPVDEDQHSKETTSTPKILESHSAVPSETVGKLPEVRPAVVNVVEHQAGSVPANTAATPSQSTADTRAEGTASITSTPDGAEIFIDSVGHGRTPSLVRLVPGKHSVQLVISGYEDWVSTIETKAGSIINVTANLRKRE